MKINSPHFNLRELVKQLILLEQHLLEKGKYCPDCIVKHLLTIEGLADEGQCLDTDGKLCALFESLRKNAQRWCQMFARRVPVLTIGQEVRRVRKHLAQHVLDPDPGTEHAMTRANPSTSIDQAGKALLAHVEAQNPIQHVSWVGFENGRFLVHQGGCVQTEVAFPRSWAGYSVVRKPGGFAPTWPPKVHWLPRAELEFQKEMEDVNQRAEHRLALPNPEPYTTSNTNKIVFPLAAAAALYVAFSPSARAAIKDFFFHSGEE